MNDKKRIGLNLQFVLQLYVLNRIIEPVFKWLFSVGLVQ